jgi:hypothetical protein
MVELAALLQRDAVVEKLPSRQPVATTRRSPAPALREEESVKPDAGKEAAISAQIRAVQSTFVACLRPPKDLDASEHEDDNDPVLPMSQEVTLAGAKAVQDFRALMSDDVKAEDGPELERQLAASAEAIETYRANAVDLVNANVNATLDYAWRTGGVRSPVEFMAVSASHTSRLFELMMTYTLQWAHRHRRRE